MRVTKRRRRSSNLGSSLLSRMNRNVRAHSSARRVRSTARWALYVMLSRHWIASPHVVRPSTITKQLSRITRWPQLSPKRSTSPNCIQLSTNNRPDWPTILPVMAAANEYQRAVCECLFFQSSSMGIRGVACLFRNTQSNQPPTALPAEIDTLTETKAPTITENCRKSLKQTHKRNHCGSL